jgi:hypothetical protein
MGGARRLPRFAPAEKTAGRNNGTVFFRVFALRGARVVRVGGERRAAICGREERKKAGGERR